VITVLIIVLNFHKKEKKCVKKPGALPGTGKSFSKFHIVLKDPSTWTRLEAGPSANLSIQVNSP
jgi:hypothetical protein